MGSKFTCASFENSQNHNRRARDMSTRVLPLVFLPFLATCFIIIVHCVNSANAIEDVSSEDGAADGSSAGESGEGLLGPGSNPADANEGGTAGTEYAEEKRVRRYAHRDDGPKQLVSSGKMRGPPESRPRAGMRKASPGSSRSHFSLPRPKIPTSNLAENNGHVSYRQGLSKFTGRGPNKGRVTASRGFSRFMPGRKRPVGASPATGERVVPSAENSQVSNVQKASDTEYRNPVQQEEVTSSRPPTRYKAGRKRPVGDTSERQQDENVQGSNVQKASNAEYRNPVQQEEVTSSRPPSRHKAGRKRPVGDTSEMRQQDESSQARPQQESPDDSADRAPISSREPATSTPSSSTSTTEVERTKPSTEAPAESKEKVTRVYSDSSSRKETPQGADRSRYEGDSAEGEEEGPADRNTIRDDDRAIARRPSHHHAPAEAEEEYYQEHSYEEDSAEEEYDDDGYSQNLDPPEDPPPAPAPSHHRALGRSYGERRADNRWDPREAPDDADRPSKNARRLYMEHEPSHQKHRYSQPYMPPVQPPHPPHWQSQPQVHMVPPVPPPLPPPPPPPPQLVLQPMPQLPPPPPPQPPFILGGAQSWDMNEFGPEKASQMISQLKSLKHMFAGSKRNAFDPMIDDLVDEAKGMLEEEQISQHLRSLQNQVPVAAAGYGMLLPPHHGM